MPVSNRSDEITSLVSIPITVCNVPDPNGISAKFIYNFYVSNEDVSFSPQPTSPIDYNKGLIDRDTIDSIEARERGSLRARVPRYVTLNIDINLEGIESYESGEVSNDLLKTMKYSFSNKSNYNIEGAVENKYSASAQIADAGFKSRLQEEIYRISSAILEEGGLEGEVSDEEIALRLNELMSSDIDASSILDALSDNEIKGVKFVNLIKTGRFSRVDVKSAIQYSAKISGEGYRRLTTDSVLTNPFTHYFESDILGSTGNSAKRNPILNTSLFPNFGKGDTDDIESFRPSIKVLDISDEISAASIKSLATKDWPFIRHVGYVIEKTGISSSGVFERFDDIVSTNTTITEFIDPNIKYGFKYFYKARQLFLVRFAQVLEIDDGGEGEVLYNVITAAIASSTPTPATVDTRETTPPQPPGTLICSFIYQAGNGVRLDWSSPINPTRDIKKYQVFRRLSMRDPFEIIAEYDFTDPGYSQFEQRELIDENLVHRVTSPQLSHIDYDFNRETSYIYCIGSVDAHGLVSNYGTQVQVTFNQFTNKVVTRVISKSGAPKAYPNYFVDPTALEEFGSDRLIEDVIKDSGHSTMRMYFNPDAYRIASDDDGSETNPIILNSDRGVYKFQIINLDRQIAKTLSVEIINDSTLDGIL